MLLILPRACNPRWCKSHRDMQLRACVTWHTCMLHIYIYTRNGSCYSIESWMKNLVMFAKLWKTSSQLHACKVKVQGNTPHTGAHMISVSEETVYSPSYKHTSIYKMNTYTLLHMDACNDVSCPQRTFIACFCTVASYYII